MVFTHMIWLKMKNLPSKIFFLLFFLLTLIFGKAHTCCGCLMLGELCGLDLLLVSMHRAVGLFVFELFPKSGEIHSISWEYQLCSPGLAGCRQEINSRICFLAKWSFWLPFRIWKWSDRVRFWSNILSCPHRKTQGSLFAAEGSRRSGTGACTWSVLSHPGEKGLRNTHGSFSGFLFR